MEVHEILQAALAGDGKATEQLIAMQREGRALRLYPNGRSGPEDDGVTPIVFYLRSDGMIVMYRGQRRGVILPKAGCGDLILKLSKFVALGLQQSHGKESMDCTDDQSWDTAIDPRGIALNLRPLNQFDLVMSPWYVREWISSVMLIIDATDESVVDWGFPDQDLFYSLLAAHIAEPEDNQ